MKIFTIAWKDVKIRLRDLKGLLLTVLMPIVLTAILGFALNGVVNGDSTSMPKMTIAVYNADSGEMGKKLVTDVLQSEDLKKYVTIKTYTSNQDVTQSVQDSKTDAGIVVPEKFTDDMMAGKTTIIKVIDDPGKQTIADIVNAVVKSYTDRIVTVADASKTVMTDITSKEVMSSNTAPVAKMAPPDFQKLGNDVANDLKNISTNPNSETKELPTGKKPVSGMQYYAAGMGVMFLLFAATVGAKSILNERSTETLARMLTSPTNKMVILLGKFLGTLISAVIQFMVFMIVTRLIFGVHWGDDVLQSIVIGVVYSVAVSGISMTVAAVIKTEQSADIITGIGIQILSLLGGSMLPLAMFPDLMRKIALVAPNTWALNSFLDIMQGTTWQALVQPICVLLSVGIVFLTVGAWRLRAR